MLKRIPDTRMTQCLADAAASPLSAPDMAYPDWYMQRWHFLPEGYLSRRSVALYDVLIRNIYNVGCEARILRRLSQLVAARSPSRVLDLACGPGNALASVRGAMPSAELTGVDLSPFMLELARDRVGFMAGVSLQHQDARHLAFSGGAFDAVTAVHYFGHLPWTERPQAWAEAARVLASNGRLYVIDHAWHGAPGVALRRVAHRPLVGGVLRLSIFAHPTTTS